MKKNTKKRIPLYEDFLQNRPDMEGAMIQSQLKAVNDYTQKISDLIKPEDQLPAWIQAKITLVKDYLDEVFHTIDSIAQQDRGDASYAANSNAMVPTSSQGGELPHTETGDFLDFDEFTATGEEPEAGEEAPGFDDEFMDDFEFSEEEAEDEEESEEETEEK